MNIVFKKIQNTAKFCPPFWHSASILKDNIFCIIRAYGKMNCQQKEGSWSKGKRKIQHNGRKIMKPTVPRYSLDLHVFVQKEFKNLIASLARCSVIRIHWLGIPLLSSNNCWVNIKSVWPFWCSQTPRKP